MYRSTFSNTTRPTPLLVRLLETMAPIDPDRLEDLFQSMDRGDTTVEESVVRAGVADELEIAQAYANHYLVPLFNPSAEKSPPVDVSIASVLPNRLCRDHLIAPISDVDGVLEVAVISPDALLLADEIKLLTGRQMRPLFAPLSVIERPACHVVR